MIEMKDGPVAYFKTRDVTTLTDEELVYLKKMSEDDLLRCSHSTDLLAIVESTRRLKVALHKEESAIKWLTGVLIVLTLILVYPVIKDLLGLLG